MTNIFEKLKSSKEMFAVEGDKISVDEYIMLSSIQGIVAQTEAKIVIKNEESYCKYIDFLKNKGYKEKAYDNAWDVVELFKAYLADFGYIKFDPNVFGDINLAATISGVERWLMIPVALEKQAVKYGLTKKRDIQDLAKLDATTKKVKIFEEYKDKLSKEALIHQSPNMPQLRDLSIALKLFCFYTDEKCDNDKAFRKKVFDWADNNIPIMGWSDDEIAFVADCSEYGKITIPMDWSSNTSYFADVRTGKPLKQKAKPKKIKAKKGEHYLSIVVSDGDNIQWITRDFFTTSTFGQRLRGRRDYKISWTFPPMVAMLGSIAADYIYSVANQNDSFITGVSGAGYINCTSYPDEHLDAFTKLTSDLIKKCDIDVVTMLDNKNNLITPEFTQKKLAYYSRFDNIKGGIWELDPDRYESGKGKIYWSDGKPFMSVRLSMWHPSNDPAKVTDEWVDSYAAAINSYGKDPSKEDGYTILNIHPWTMTINNVERLISKLESHIKIVSASEIIELAKKNITNKN